MVITLETQRWSAVTSPYSKISSTFLWLGTSLEKRREKPGSRNMEEEEIQKSTKSFEAVI